MRLLRTISRLDNIPMRLFDIVNELADEEAKRTGLPFDRNDEFRYRGVYRAALKAANLTSNVKISEGDEDKIKSIIEDDVKKALRFTISTLF